MNAPNSLMVIFPESSLSIAFHAVLTSYSPRVSASIPRSSRMAPTNSSLEISPPVSSSMELNSRSHDPPKLNSGLLSWT